MYHVSAQGVDERMTNVHYYYYYNVALETQINNVVTMQVQLSKIGVRQDHKNKSDVLLTLCVVKTQKKEVVGARERQTEKICHTHTHTHE